MGFPIATCKEPAQPLVNFEHSELETLDFFRKQRNCFIFYLEGCAIRVNKNGCIKIHIKGNRRSILKIEKSIRKFASKVIQKLRPFFFRSCLIGYSFETRNIQIKGKFPYENFALIKFCVKHFSSAQVSIGQLDPIVGSTIVYTEIKEPVDSLFSKIQARGDGFIITITYRGFFCGIVYSINDYCEFYALVKYEIVSGIDISRFE